MKLLSLQFPDFKGLNGIQDFGGPKEFPKITTRLPDEESVFLQIYHLERHFVCVSGIYGFTEDNHVVAELQIYDSLNTKSIDKELVSKISSQFKNTKVSVLRIRKVEVTGQKNLVDCGLHSIANATMICHNVNPGTVKLDIKNLRLHLIKCLESNQMTTFGYTANKKHQIICQDDYALVYCVCRKECKGKMFQCDECFEFFHKSCLSKLKNYDVKNIKPKSQWLCPFRCDNQSQSKVKL